MPTQRKQSKPQRETDEPLADGPVALDTGPRSLIRTLRILEQLAAVPQGATLAMLSVELQSPKSSLLGLLRPLCSYGYIVNTEGRYVLGPAAYRLGLSIMPTVSISRIATPIMRELVDRCGETVLVAVMDREAGTAVYVEKIESTQSIRYSVAIGTARPLYCSAAGRVLLAHSDEEYIERYLRRAPFTPLTPQTLTRAADLRRLLPQVREQGLSITIGEVSSDVAGFAAPIFDHQGRVIAALAMAAPVSRTRADPQHFAHHMREAADSISFGFGHAGAALTMAPGSEVRTAEPAATAAPEKRRRMPAATG
ncbi:IclR family transcriptional regulator [Aquabacterium sp. J223]|uniref:IclR family transcriptional regulator n=1 Tax=Aquabacterium sp. J223 TaxID=2898431 RepID=UPI0021AD8B38|nr:IclR family transcriptional regulator [Aquabacterium sp. J223]UUX97343.1 IclR family transcriptional regulator [Aquabacterium sp. J223]